MASSINVLSTYQQKLRLTFLQACQWLLLFAIVIALSRLGREGAWTLWVKLATYSSSLAILWFCLYRLRTKPTAQLEQAVASATLLICAATYMFVAPESELLLGTIAFALVLFHCVIAEGLPLSLRWYGGSILLYIGALLLRQFFPSLQLTYQVELIVTLFLMPILLSWGGIRFGSRIIYYLNEMLQAGKELQADLLQSERQYRQLLESMNEGFIVADEGDVFRYVNDKFCEIFGYTRAELLNRRNSDVLGYDEENLEILRRQMTMRTHKQSSTYELTAKRKDGKPVHLLVSAMPKFDGEAFRGASCVVMDITERKDAERALQVERELLSERVKEQTESLRTATAALQHELQERKRSETEQARLIEQLAKAARLKDEFLASMSHELRTPLNSILGMAEALQDKIYGELTERQSKALGTIETSGRHLLALINDILDLAKIESGQIDLVHDAVDVLAVCESCLRLIQPVARKKELQVKFTIDPSVKVMMADGRRFKQLLINLLSNAQKFTPTGGTIGLAVEPVNGGTQLAFTVWDSGVGIPADALPHLFEPFVQVDSSLSRSYEGTGLGLALVKGVAELHNGQVTVESTPGEGSRFVVTLPWLRPTNSPEHSVNSLVHHVDNEWTTNNVAEQ